jgi:hypothetical protein
MLLLLLLLLLIPRKCAPLFDGSTYFATMKNHFSVLITKLQLN